MNLQEISGVVMDMDGVLWRGDEVLPGMTDLFAMLRERDLPFVLASNNSSKSPSDYVTKLAGMGVPDLREDQIVTSGTTSVDYLRTHYPPPTRVHVLGGAGLKRMVDAAGFERVDERADVVVVGIDFDLTYERLKRASLLIRAGADFIGTNDDTTFPSPEGLIPGAGSLLALLRASSEREPLVMGKPGAPMFETALRLLGMDAGSALMIGDRLNTDIAGAQAVGLQTALVLTGVATEADLAAGEVKPDAVYAGLPELIAAWQAA